MQMKHKSFEIHIKEKALYSFVKLFLINGNQSKFFQYFHSCSSEVQYIAILLWTQTTFLTYDDQNSASRFVHALSRNVSFKATLEEYSQNQSSFLEAASVVAWIYFISLVLIFGYLGKKVFKRENISPVFQLKLTYLFQLHFGLIFWIANMVFMINISYKQQGIEIPMFVGLQSQDQIFYLIQFLFILLNYGIGFMTATLCFDPFCSDNIFSVRTSTYQVLNFSFKAIIAPVAVFASPTNVYSRMILIIITCSISITRFIYLLRVFPFYREQPMRLSIIFSASALWISLVNILAVIWLSNDMISVWSPIFLIILALPIIVKLSLLRFEKHIEICMNANPNALQTKDQIFGKLFVQQMLETKAKISLNDNISLEKSDIYFIGHLVGHGKGCKNPECICSFLFDDKTSSNITKTKASLSVFFRTLNSSFLIEAVRRIKDNDELKITLAHLLFVNPISGPELALIYLFATPDEYLSFFMKIKKLTLARNIQERIMKYFDEGSQDKLNINKFIDYHNDSAGFLSQIISVTDQYLNFWETYRKPNLKMNDMLKRSNQIEKAADNLDKLWNLNNQKYDSFYQLMKDHYRMYLNIVRNTPLTSAEIVKKLRWKKQLQNFDPTIDHITQGDLFSSKILSLFISMMKDKIGKVLYASDNVIHSLGYSSQDIIGKNISCLMPTLIGEKHDQLLLKHLDKFRAFQTKGYYSHTSYAKTKDGFIVPCCLHISIFPYTQKELIYIGLIKVLTSQYEYIMIDSDGRIDSFTQTIGQKLNLSLGENAHINEVCLDIGKLDPSLNKITISVLMRDIKSSSREFPIRNHNKLEYTEKNEADPANVKVLTFVKKTSQITYHYYKTKIIRKTYIDRNIHILELESTSNTEIKSIKKADETFHRMETTKKSDEDGSNPDIPTEKIPLEFLGIEIFSQVMSPESKENFIQSARPKSYGLLKTEPFSQMTYPNSKENHSPRIGLKSELSKRMDTEKKHEDLYDSAFDKNGATTTAMITLISHSNRKAFKKVNTSVSGEDLDRSQKQDVITMKSPHTKFMPIESERGSNASTDRNVHGKLEKAMYAMPQDRSVGIIKIAVFIIVIMCVILLALFYFTTKSNLSFVKENISVITTSNLRLFQITELNRRARLISMLKVGLIDDKRYLVFKVKSVFMLALQLMLESQKVLTQYNNMVRTALERVEIDLQQQFYNNLIPIIDPSTQKAMQNSSVFDAANFLIIQAKKIVAYNPLTLALDAPEVNFILNNTLNEQLLVSEQITNIILDDNSFKLESIRNLVFYFIVLCSALGAGMLMFFLFYQIKCIRDQNKFIQIFLRLNDDEISKQITQVKNFRDSLSGNGFDYQYVRLDTLPLARERSLNVRNVKGFRMKSKEADMKDINNKKFIAQVLAWMLFAMIMIPFIYLSFATGEKRDIIKEEAVKIVKVNSYLYDLNLISTGLYEYVQYNITTKVRTRKIDEEFDATFKRIVRSQEVFTDLVQDAKGYGTNPNSDLELLLTGNLCTALNASQSACIVGQGILTEGLIGMNTFIQLTLRRVKDMFDVSDRTLLKSRTILNFDNIIQMEYIYTTFQMPAYQKLGDILQSFAETHIQEVLQLLEVAVMVSVAIYIFFGYLFTTILCKLVHDDKVTWKKVIRKIPFNIALSNKAFKGYLVNQSSNLLGSVKNSL